MEMSSLTVSGSRLETLAARPVIQVGAFKDARVHFISLKACAEREAELLGLLSPAERERAREINHHGRRIAYIASRAMLREALTDFTDHMVPRNEWVFDTGLYGKPQVMVPGAPTPRFSLSYTEDVMVIAVSQLFELGVDLETVPTSGMEIPWQVLSAAERRFLHTLPVAEQTTEFLRLWTLKEAYTKYYGFGATLDFRGVEVDLKEVSASAALPRDQRLNEPMLHQQMMTVDGQDVVFALAGGRPRI